MGGRGTGKHATQRMGGGNLMSLQSLIDLRTKHRMAPNAVWVIVGNPPKWLHDDPSMVVIRPGAKNLDLRALVGLHVDVIEIGNDGATLLRVMNAVESANPKTKSLACMAGVAGLNAEHEQCLERARRLLCT